MNKIKDKIRALLAKAQGTDNANEAEAFLAKASELMERHQLELFELNVEDPIGMTKGVDAQPGPPSYKSDVQRALAKFYGARPVINCKANGHWTIEICGPESSRLTTELMTDFVWQQVNDQAKKLVTPYCNKQAAIRQVAKALCDRIYTELKERKVKQVNDGTSSSLVVMDAVQLWIEKHYQNLSKTKSQAKRIGLSAMDAAKNISLHHQTGDRNQLRIQ
jgi:hypothetical protein